MNNMFARLAKQSGKAFAEVKASFKDAKAQSAAKGYKKGGTAYIQHAFKVLRDAHKAPAPKPPEPTKKARKESDAPKTD